MARGNSSSEANSRGGVQRLLKCALQPENVYIYTLVNTCVFTYKYNEGSEKDIEWRIGARARVGGKSKDIPNEKRYLECNRSRVTLSSWGILLPTGSELRMVRCKVRFVG